MIKISKSPTADTRTCDFAKVTKDQLYASSVQHIEDVRSGLAFFRGMLKIAGAVHDGDKLSDIDDFHADFVTGFAQTGWWDNHRKVNRHHLLQADGVPADVNLIDVLDMIADCVMAGMARSGEVYKLNIDADVLRRAFDNTVELLKAQVVVSDTVPISKEQILAELRTDLLTESKDVLGTDHEQWATGLQRAVTLIERKLGTLDPLFK